MLEARSDAGHALASLRGSESIGHGGNIRFRERLFPDLPRNLPAVALSLPNLRSQEDCSGRPKSANFGSQANLAGPRSSKQGRSDEALEEWDEAFLELHFVQGRIQESNALDYKDSRSLGKQSPERLELCKDTSAFANAGGGMIIYGITENKHEPTGIDEGVDISAITKEYIEDVLTSNIRPKIEDLEIKVVPLPSKGANRAAIVLRIGQATASAPCPVHITRSLHGHASCISDERLRRAR